MRRTTAVIVVSPEADVGTLAHECFHATSAILNYVGTTLTSETEESYAYLLDWLVGWTFKKLQDAKSKTEQDDPIAA